VNEGIRGARVSFYTLGCKLNQAETESLSGRFREAGFGVVPPSDTADVYVANTCTVTHVADRKSRHWLRLARRRNPEAFIVATGCYAQRAPQELTPIADLVLGNEEKEHLLELLMGLPVGTPTGGGPLRRISWASLSFRHKGQGWLENPADSGREEQTQGSQVFRNTARVRSLIKIQDGCEGACSYCIVPRVRPCEYSLPVPRIVSQIRSRAAMGCREVVLTGTKIGSYMYEGAGLGDLLKCILRGTDVERLRLSSLQPEEVSADLLGLWEDKRLCRHFHLALQAGSDTVLHRMRRRYSVARYWETVSLVREAVPGAAITTDIMVGFPGESSEDFEQSFGYCRRIGYANIHVFTFSPRPGTEAAGMGKQVDDRIKKERSSRMLELARTCRDDFRDRFLGQTASVLWEKETEPGGGIYSGLTDNYIRVFARNGKLFSNRITAVRLVRRHGSEVWGEPVDEDPS
jgi:threonylcarbamoyladenosine tRNA methylthiotransferase MtaB